MITANPRDGIRYIVDGQQRITTLMLLLIYLRRSSSDATGVEPLIRSETYGDHTYQLDVDERKDCLDHIMDHGADGDGRFGEHENESVRNLWRQYGTISNCFPSDLTGRVLPYFSDWLQHRVIFVEISAPDQDMALEIFETMNDRGLRLNNIDMLKSYLLARVGEGQIEKQNVRWRTRVTELTDTEKNSDAEFVKAWLRGNYAQTQRQRKARSTPEDFDIIGTAFHKWVRDNSEQIGLKDESSYRNFVEEFFCFSQYYLDLLGASQELKPGLEAVYYNAQTGFTLQFLVILATLTPDDDRHVLVEKAALVAGALDIFVVRRMVNYRNFGYSTVVYNIFNLAKSVRNRTTDELKPILASWLENDEERVDGIERFALNQRNRSHIRYILARITAWLDSELGEVGKFREYLDRSRTHPYEVEHVVANHFEQHTDEFESEHEFQEWRNKIGGLVLLPKNINASYGDKSYRQKVRHYGSQNSLARSLNASAYEHNPTFMRVREKYGLDFQDHDEFNKDDILRRNGLYKALAEIVWDPVRLGIER